MTEEQIREEALRRYPFKISQQGLRDPLYDGNLIERETFIEGAKFVLDALKEKPISEASQKAWERYTKHMK